MLKYQHMEPSSEIYPNNEGNKKHSVVTALYIILKYSLSIFFLIGGLALLYSPLTGICNLLIGILLFPPIHKYIQQLLPFNLTRKGKGISVLILFIISIVALDDPPSDGKTKEQVSLEKEQLLENKKKDSIRRANLNHSIETAQVLFQNGEVDSALVAMNEALSFASVSNEFQRVNKTREDILHNAVESNIKKHRYKQALPYISELLAANDADTTLLVTKATCLHKTGETQAAVTTLKQAMTNGSISAFKLHENINPIRKRVAYYVTRCCDGSTSSATGRGACSHHGGVCNWNDPVYEEYRKYE